ncbi:MAG: hypothetical protein AAF226_15885 [Verrucomicrobiota bacterium]
MASGVRALAIKMLRGLPRMSATLLAAVCKVEGVIGDVVVMVSKGMV